jgi:hypothetical protein
MALYIEGRGGVRTLNYTVLLDYLVHTSISLDDILLNYELIMFVVCIMCSMSKMSVNLIHYASEFLTIYKAAVQNLLIFFNFHFSKQKESSKI